MPAICKLNVNSGQNIIVLTKNEKYSLFVILNGFINISRVFLFIFRRLFF